MYVNEQKLILKSDIVDESAAITIPQCSEYICGAVEYGSHPNSQ